jgi:hypothetical protein
MPGQYVCLIMVICESVGLCLDLLVSCVIYF